MGFTAGYKVNENTQYEFTVSDETISEVVTGGGITEADIADYCYTALIDNRVHRLIAADTADPINFSSAAAIRAWSHEHTPYYFGEPEYVISNTDLNGESDAVYERNFLVWHGTIYPDTENEKTGTFLVMDMVDIKRWYINYDTSMFYETELESTSTREGGTFTGYNGTAYSYNSSAIAGNPEFRCDNNDPLLNPDTNLGVINVLVINDELWIGQLNPSNKGKNEILYAYSVYANYISPTLRGYIDNTISEQPTYYQKGTVNFAGIPTVTDMNYPEISGETFTFQSYAEGANDYIIDVSGKYGGDWHVTTGGVLCKTLNALKNWMSWCGLKFKYDNTMYKPIIEQGVIVGYTDDMSVPSEYDDMTNVTGNNISPSPPSPPSPGADEDNDDPVNTAGAPYAKGLVNYYALTAGSVLIDHISKALSTWDLQNTGKDLFKNLVSCKLIKPPAAIPTTGSEPFTIYGEKPQYEGADITLPVVSGNPDASFGPYSISRKFNDFRDYAPYTRVCIYLPYCGWCELPSHVVGRSITVKYFTDIIAATVRAVVFCGNNIVAEAAGVMGLDIPFTADAVGMKQAGVVSGLTAYAGGALQTAAGVASIVTTKGGKGIGEALSGASKLVSAYTQTAIAFNENTTEISGKNGDGCCLSGATNIIIKIIRPKYGASSSPPYVPAGFGHSVGFVSNKQVRVGNVSGLLIADNVDTTGIAGATDAERAEIKRVLETGLIVNAAPE